MATSARQGKPRKATANDNAGNSLRCFILNPPPAYLSPTKIAQQGRGDCTGNSAKAYHVFTVEKHCRVTGPQ